MYPGGQVRDDVWRLLDHKSNFQIMSCLVQDKEQRALAQKNIAESHIVVSYIDTIIFQSTFDHEVTFQRSE